MVKKEKKGVKKKVKTINVIYTTLNKIWLRLCEIWSKIGESSSQIQAIMIIVLVLITLYYALSTERMADSMIDDFEATNRPYLEIKHYVGFMDESGHLLISGDKSHNVLDFKYIIFQTKIINHGNIPAEIISKKIEIPKLNYIGSDNDIITIYPNSPYDSNSKFKIENGIIDLFDTHNNSIELKTSMDYRIHDNKDRLFNVVNRATCKYDAPENHEDYGVGIGFTCYVSHSFTT